MKIKVRQIKEGIELPKVIKKGEWIDLRAADTVILNAPQAGVLKYHTVNGEKEGHRDVNFDYTLIPLGIAMKLPEGFEAITAPRSSTFKNYGIIQANMIGVIDNSYSGDNDEWLFPAVALRDTIINKGDRICQFRIQLSQKATFLQKLKWLLSSKIEIINVKHLCHRNRGGIGSTGAK